MGEGHHVDAGPVKEQVVFDVVPFTQEHLELARSAWRKYGKGKHPASLNFCDCCAYALSKASGEPLLFKGADFRQTDATPAAPDAV